MDIPTVIMTIIAIIVLLFTPAFNPKVVVIGAEFFVLMLLLCILGWNL